MAIQTDKLQYGGSLMLFTGSGSAKLPIGFSTSAKMEIKMSTRDISNKDSGNFKQKLGGKLEWSASSDALYSETITGTTQQDFGKLEVLMIARTPVNLVFAATSGTTPVFSVDATKRNLTGMALITSLSLNAPDGETPTYSVTFEGAGDLVMA